MTVVDLSYPYHLGGSNGGNRQALAQAQSSAAYPSGFANLGAIAAQNAAARAAWQARLEPPEDAGIRAGEIIGYRGWMLQSDGLLRSMIAPYVWQPDHIEKANDLTWSGYHAFKTIRQVLNTYGNFTFVAPLVIGTVALWGEVIEHEGGYRAEYAAVHSLLEIHRWGRQFKRRSWQIWRPSNPLNDIRKLYGVAQ